MIIETVGRIFRMYIQAETEDGMEDIVANVAMEPSMGLLMITAGGVAVAGSWPDREKWGTSTFEEFLCSRTPSWITGKMMGDDAMTFDYDRTRAALLDVCKNSDIADVHNFLEHVDSDGEIHPSGQQLADSLGDGLQEPVDGFIFMQTTGFAEFLIEGGLPAFLEKIAPPPVVKDQTYMKLC